MKAIQTHLLTPSSMPQSTTEKDWVYNGLDCCVTLEVLEAIEPQLTNLTAPVYAFSRDLQGPILDMNMRGVLVDQEERARAIKEYNEIISQVSSQLDRIVKEGIGLNSLNWRSPDQLKHLFYDIMGIPPVKKKGGVETVERNALEKISASYFMAEPIINHILTLRDIGKKVSTLKTRVDSDGRIRTSFNIAGTNTGRLSSSLSEFEESGGNLQNIEERLRQIFIADGGKKFAYIDLEQAESRAVGAIEWNLFKDGRYLDACESGDLHTSVSKLAWPQMPWTGDLVRDKAVAETPFYRQHSHRHMAKVLGHGTNYLGTPPTMEKHTKVPRDIIGNFQSVYFAGFPAHQLWHEWVREQLREHGYLISLMNRPRWFFGRWQDDDVWRAAVAYDPQGSIGDILNRGMLKIWLLNICELLLQVHDAVLVQYPEEREDEVLPRLLEEIKIPVPLEHGRTLVIPTEAQTGWNWAKYNEKTNPDGLKKYSGNDKRSRTRAPEASLLDRRVSSVY